VHTGRAPQRVLARELADELADLPGSWGSCGNPVAARFPRPIETEPPLVPADQGVRAEDDERGSALGPDTIQPHPEETLATARPEPSAISCGDHRTLLTKAQDFQVQEASAPDKSGHRREHREEERLHPKDATALEEKKSTKSSSTEFLVGTGLGRVPLCRRALAAGYWAVETTSAKALTTDVFARVAAEPGLSRVTRVPREDSGPTALTSANAGRAHVATPALEASRLTHRQRAHRDAVACRLGSDQAAYSRHVG
jgi:hypothetical protein